MQNRAQVEAKLRQETRDTIFNRQLSDVLAQKQAERERNEGMTFAERVDANRYTVSKPTWGEDPPVFKVAGDDKFKSKKWEALMGECAFYLDRPSLKDESEMKRTLQTKFDDLFPGAVMRPTLQSRKDLVTWACESQNAYMQKKEAPEDKIMDCTRYQGLLDRYGPNYEALKGRVGHLRGLFN
mmetsp:Transcript_8186/g.11335  ORF Transcript_8186/g.11335 Transcript_8186/m.11335 type:complete len:183 (-) Transcript_8186:922-1470(-)